MLQRQDLPTSMGTRWCFTINNPTAGEEEDLATIIQKLQQQTLVPSNDNPVTYLIFEKEHTDGIGTPHIQGFFRLYQQKQLRWIRRHISGFARAHLEVARGSDEQNRTYCSKEGKAIEAGSYRQPTQKKPNVWDEIKTMIESGATVEEIRSEYPCQFMSRMAGITQWVLEVQQNRNSQPYNGELSHKNIWVWGPSGTGKSRWAHNLPGAKYLKLANKWWDGYNNQPVVVMEDLDPAHCTALAQHLKIWADRYLFTAEVKGGHKPIYPGYQLVVTSNYHPDRCFTNPEDAEAIRRRFTICEMRTAGFVPDWPPRDIITVDDEEEEEE